MTWLHRLLTRLFKTEEINGHGRCPTYLYRWHLARLFGFALYVHRFVADDWSLDLHDHPKRFVTLMFWGGYIETTAAGDRRYRAPCIRSFPGEHAHRTRLGDNREAWTLVLTCRAGRQWGFWHNGGWIHWREYVRGESSHIADARAVCSSVE